MDKFDRICNICKKEISMENLIYKEGYIQNTCRECVKERLRNWKIANKDKVKEYQKEWKNANEDKYKIYRENYRAKEVEQKYGITIEEFNRKLKLQLNGCAICKEEFKSGKDTCIDHNHKTGKVRDLLCTKCNFLVGFSRESEDLIWNLLEYLKRHNESPEKEGEETCQDLQ